MTFELSEQTLEIRDRVVDFMEKHVYPVNHHYQAVARSERRNDPDALAFVDDLRAQAKELGLWNLFFPHLREDEPGTGLSNYEYAPIFEEMAKLPWAPEVFNCHAPVTGNMELLGAAANEAQRRKWLLPLLEGECYSCFAATEPQVASSDATNYETTITRDGDDYVVNGRKWFISLSMHPKCRFMILMGKTNPENPNRHAQHGVILIPMDTPGVQILQDATVINAHHVGGHPEILLDNVRVPAENKLVGANSFKDTAKVLTDTRYGVAWEGVGHAIASYEAALTYAKEREIFGRPEASFQLIQNKLANMLTEITNMQLMCFLLAELLDQGKMTPGMASMAKMNTARKGKQVCSDARDILGGNGILLEYQIAKHLADMEVVYTYEGTDIVQSLILGREITGTQAFAPPRN